MCAVHGWILLDITACMVQILKCALDGLWVRPRTTPSTWFTQFPPHASIKHPDQACQPAGRSRRVTERLHHISAALPNLQFRLLIVRSSSIMNRKALHPADCTTMCLFDASEIDSLKNPDVGVARAGWRHGIGGSMSNSEQVWSIVYHQMNFTTISSAQQRR